MRAKAKSWRDFAQTTRDVSDNRDNTPPNVPNVPNVPDTLSPALRQGLHRLEEMAVPAIVRSERWPEVVNDALRLADGGWVSQALALGWSDLDLFGAAAAECDTDGLAVWLGGSAPARHHCGLRLRRDHRRAGLLQSEHPQRRQASLEPWEVE